MSDPLSAQPDARAESKSRLHELMNVLGVYALVIALYVSGCLVYPQFRDIGYQINILRDIMLLGIVSVGVAFITYSRHYVDLSIPGIMSLSGIIAISALPFGIGASIVAGVAAGLLVGAINGLVVGYLRLNPIIWTLAMMSVLSGVIRKAYAGQQVYPDEATAAGQAFLNLYHAKILGFLPLPFAILLVLAVVAEISMRKTVFGAQLKMTGSAYDTARLTGINVRGVVALSFIISAFASSIAGIMLTSFNKVGAHYIGTNYDFQSITAVVLGGMTLAGGRGNVVGVLGGAMVIVLLNRLLSLVRIGAFTVWDIHFGPIVIGDFQKNIILGAVFILVVGIGHYSRRKSGVDDE